MKIFYIVILICYIISYSSFGDNGISISLAKISDNHFYFIEKKNNNTRKGRVFVTCCILLRNEGNKKIGIFSEDCSFGYFNWTLEIKKGNEITKIKRNSKFFLNKSPIWSIIFPKETFVIPLDLSKWEYFDLRGKNGIQIRVIFSQRENPESKRMFQNKIYQKYSNLLFKGTVKSKWYSLNISDIYYIKLEPVNKNNLQ